MELDHPLTCLTFNFQRTTRSLVRGFEAALRPLNLSAPQFTTLTLLSGFGAMSVSQLAEKMGTERTTMSRNLDVLRAKGWVISEGTTDLRLRLCEITPDGRALLTRAMPAWHQWQAQVVETIGPDFAKSLLTTMAKL